MSVDFAYRDWRRGRESEPERQLLAWFATARRQLEQQVCGLRGHAIFKRFEPRKLSLHCERCGYQTPGWEIGGTLRPEERLHASGTVEQAAAQARRVA